MSVPVAELSELRARSTLLEEATYQMEELEHVNEELNNTILKLREGKVSPLKTVINCLFTTDDWKELGFTNIIKDNYLVLR